MNKVKLECLAEHRFQHPIVVVGESEEDCDRKAERIGKEVKKAVVRAAREAIEKPFFDTFTVGYCSAIVGFGLAVAAGADYVVTFALVAAANIVGRKISRR